MTPGSNPVAGVARIASVGVELPERRLSTTELVASCRRPLEADVERLTGIRERRVCGDGESSWTLATAAALDCIACSDTPPSEVEMVVCCSIAKARTDVAYVYEPPMSVAVQRAIGADRAVCFDVANACAGMVTGLSIVNDFIRRGAIRRGMVVSGEYISHIARTATRNVTCASSPEMASLTLGDAGAAVLLERATDGEGGILACELQSIAEHSDLCIAKPADRDEPPGWVMRTEALKLHLVAIDSAAPIIARACAGANIPIDTIDWVIPHQTTNHAIRIGTLRVLRDLGAQDFEGRIVNNLEDFGNTASTTHFLALHRCLAEGRIVAGERVLLLTFASGVVVGAVVIDIDDGLARRFTRRD